LLFELILNAFFYFKRTLVSLCTTGALNGKTIELAEAQAILEVCKWRLSELEKQQIEESNAPPARWGASLTSKNRNTQH
jgi:hypothetical protein